MKVGFFGSMSDRLGREVEVDASQADTVAALRKVLADAFPDAASQLLSPTLKACIDDSIVSEEACLRGAQRVEFFPPLSGG